VGDEPELVMDRGIADLGSGPSKPWLRQNTIQKNLGFASLQEFFRRLILLRVVLNSFPCSEPGMLAAIQR